MTEATEIITGACAQTGIMQKRIGARRSANYKKNLEILRAAGYNGWLAKAFAKMGEANRFLLDLTQSCTDLGAPNDVRKLIYSDLMGLAAAFQAAAAGEATKQRPSPVVVAASTRTSIPITIKTVGARVRIQQPLLNRDYRGFPLELWRGNPSSGGTLLYAAYVRPRPGQASQDLVLLAISNSAGEASLIGLENLFVSIPADAVVPTTTTVEVESLNVRDITG